MRQATLLECRDLVAHELRDAALSLDQPDFVGLVDHYLRQAQRYLWLAHEWPMLWSVARFATIADEPRYPLPPGVLPHGIRSLEVAYDGIVRRVQPGRGDSELYDASVLSEPVERWWLDAEEAGRPLALWPTPRSVNQVVAIRYQKELEPFYDPSHMSTLDADLLALYASAELAAARGLPDAQVKAKKAEAYLRELKARLSPVGGRAFSLAGRRSLESWRETWQPRVPR